MNREIKFRGKRVDNGEWVYGYLSFIYIDVNRARIYDPKTVRSYDVLLETVGQYTGLKDKNDKEIYEGDILHCDGYWDIYVVWDDKKACFAYLCTDWVVSQGRLIILSNLDLSQYEIMTNIYKNPELLIH